MPATLVLTHEPRKCLIDDISSTGARLRIVSRPGKGTLVLLSAEPERT